MTCTRFYSDGRACQNIATFHSMDYGAICNDCYQELLKSYDRNIANFLSGNEPDRPWSKQKLNAFFKKIKDE